MRVKCNTCGSSNILIVCGSKKKGTFIIDPKNVNQSIIAKLKKDGLEDSMFECHGDCSDECSATIEVDKLRFSDSDSFLEYLIGGDSNGKSIETAIYQNDIAFVKSYMDSGGDVDALTKNGDHWPAGWTLLCLAIDCKSYEIAKMLISAGADVNKPIDISISRATPLHFISGNKYRSAEQIVIVDMLMDRGADPYAKDASGDTCLDYADMWSKKAMKMHIIKRYQERK